MPDGPTSSARSLTSMARPGRRPLLVRQPGEDLHGGGRQHPGDRSRGRPGRCPRCRRTGRGPGAGSRGRPSRTPAATARRWCVRGEPAGGPPTLMSPPSSRPKVDTARADGVVCGRPGRPGRPSALRRRAEVIEGGRHPLAGRARRGRRAHPRRRGRGPWRSRARCCRRRRRTRGRVMPRSMAYSSRRADGGRLQGCRGVVLGLAPQEEEPAADGHDREQQPLDGVGDVAGLVHLGQREGDEAVLRGIGLAQLDVGRQGSARRRAAAPAPGQRPGRRAGPRCRRGRPPRTRAGSP